METESVTDSCLKKKKSAKKPVKFVDEKLHLRCEWENCSYETTLLNIFTDHVEGHVAAPNFEMLLSSDESSNFFLVCKWGNCSYLVTSVRDILRHLYIHVYHTKLKSLGKNSLQRVDQGLVCRSDPEVVNVIPEVEVDFRCGWESCTISCLNVQEYYDHVRYHCEDNEKGKAVPGGIKCGWIGCNGSFPNITKLRDHVKSHTREKLTACPSCGCLFATRTRLIDHCHRQKEEEIYSCELCLKQFGSARLLRGHIRSHVNNYRCSECDMSCVSPSALLSHVKYRHTDESPNQCSLCDYAAKTESDLARHKRLHATPLLSCQLDECEFQARNLQALKTHQLKIHSDRETRYRCHLCERCYTRGNTLSRHLIRVHSLQWPSGHVRFRFNLQEDGSRSLLTVRYESEEVQTVRIERNEESESPRRLVMADDRDNAMDI